MKPCLSPPAVVVGTSEDLSQGFKNMDCHIYLSITSAKTKRWHDVLQAIANTKDVGIIE